MTKDPRRQYQGAVSKAKGKFFEDLIDKAFDYYRYKGLAVIEKTPEPMRATKPLGNGQFVAFFEKKAQPDYKGTLKGGRSVLMEAKFTSAEKMEQSRVRCDQADNLTTHQRLGAMCFVLVGFDSGATYRIPWEIWQNMKEHYGRKYVKEADIQKYKVVAAHNGIPLVLENLDGKEDGNE